MEEIYQFSAQMAEVFPGKKDLKKIMNEAVASMKRKGLLEQQDEKIIKKAFAIKIN